MLSFTPFIVEIVYLAPVLMVLSLLKFSLVFRDHLEILCLSLAVLVMPRSTFEANRTPRPLELFFCIPQMSTRVTTVETFLVSTVAYVNFTAEM
jgi:hypothetical protein